MKLLYVQNQSRQTQLVQPSKRGYHSIFEPSGPNHPLKEKVEKISRILRPQESASLTEDGILVQIEVTFA